MTKSFCALCGCGAADVHLLAGTHGFVCFACLAQAFSAVATTYGQPRGADTVKSRPTASDRCHLCDTPVAAGSLVAYRHPYCFCGSCLSSVFDLCLAPELEQDRLSGKFLAIINF